MRVVVAGGGVAGLEGLLALRALAGDRIDLTLVAPDPEFTYRPLAVAEPFGLGHAHRVPLSQFTEDAGAELVIDSTVGVDDNLGEIRLRESGARSLDALLVAPGATPVPGLEGATTWWPGGDPEVYGGLLRDIDEGYSKRIAIVVPLGAVWPLPAYELALMTAGEATGHGPRRRGGDGRDPGAPGAVAVRRRGRRGDRRGATQRRRRAQDGRRRTPRRSRAGARARRRAAARFSASTPSRG